MAANLIETVYISFLGTQELAALVSIPDHHAYQKYCDGVVRWRIIGGFAKIGEGNTTWGGWLQHTACFFTVVIFSANYCCLAQSAGILNCLAPRRTCVIGSVIC